MSVGHQSIHCKFFCLFYILPSVIQSINISNSCNCLKQVIRLQEDSVNQTVLDAKLRQKHNFLAKNYCTTITNEASPLRPVQSFSLAKTSFHWCKTSFFGKYWAREMRCLYKNLSTSREENIFLTLFSLFTWTCKMFSLH